MAQLAPAVEGGGTAQEGAGAGSDRREGRDDRLSRGSRLDAENAVIKIALARVLLKLNLDDESRKIIADLETRGYLEPEAEKVKSQLELRAAAAEAGPLDEARKLAAAAPSDLNLQLKLSDALAVANRHEEALPILLDIIHKDKAGVGVEAKNTMIRIFDTLGAGSELVGLRRKLATALY